MTQPKRIKLATLPTPLVRLERLGARLDGADILLKRDDLTGLELSGNKVRKLEFVAADVLATGCDTLVTEGTPQSNHCRATAAVCAKLGLHCVVLLRPPPSEGSPQGNHLLDVLFGAEVRVTARDALAARGPAIVADLLDDLRAQGRAPRWTPMGASEPLAVWGYMRAAAELDEQLEARGIAAADVVCAISSGATFAGLVLGQRVYGLKRLNLWAVPVSDDVPFHVHSVAELCAAAIERFKLPVEIPAEELQFVDGYVGDGYAIAYPDDIAAIHALARSEGIVLDPVYTGKAFAALLDGVRQRRWGFERPVVFVHTGGVFSDFAWPDLIAPA